MAKLRILKMKNSCKAGAVLLSFFFLFCQSGFSYHLNRADKKFLDEVSYRAFLYFWENTNEKNGLTRDRARNFEIQTDTGVASSASVGFALTALGIGHNRGWIKKEQAYGRALNTLKHFRDQQKNVEGWFYHWLNMETGEREWNSELSSIDTALFLAGVIFISEYFKGTEVEKIGYEIYRRVNFTWMMTDGGKMPEERTLSMGWNPESGFLVHRWNSYSEQMILYILGLGSPTYPLPPESWEAWDRPVGSYVGYVSIAQAPLFTHQYSHCWIDFRNLRDKYADYFKNSVNATLANRTFCIDMSRKYKTYGADCWGLTASDGPDGYHAYGAPPGYRGHDGTVAPTAAGGSIVFTPELSLKALKFMKKNYGEKIWGRYGFCDSFNTDPRWKKNFNLEGMWRSGDVLGIDQGAILLMVENLRTGLVWKTFMKSPYVRKGMERAGFLKSGREIKNKSVIDLSGFWNFNSPQMQNFEVRVPGEWPLTFESSATYRKRVTIPAGWAGKDVVIIFGNINDVDAVFLNGRWIGGMGLHSPVYRPASGKMRVYRVPGEAILYDKENEIIVEVYNRSGAGGITDAPVKIGLKSELDYDPVRLDVPEPPAAEIIFKDRREEYSQYEENDIPLDFWVIPSAKLRYSKEENYFKNWRVSLESSGGSKILDRAVGEMERQQGIFFQNLRISSEYSSATFSNQPRLVLKDMSDPSKVLAQAEKKIKLYDGILLSGKWKFKAGDVPKGENPAFNDSSWPEIEVPANWENEGFAGYDGVAWYRKKVQLSPKNLSSNVSLILGAVDDDDRTFWNGKEIGSTSGWMAQRVYAVPKKLIKKENLIAVRVMDTGGGGGIYKGPVLIGVNSRLKKPD